MVGCGMGMVPRPCPAAVQGPGAEMPYRYVSHPIVRAGCRICAGMLLFLAAALAAALPGAARAQSPLQQFLAEVPAGELVPGADAYCAPTGSPPLAPALKGGDLEIARTASRERVCQYGSNSVAAASLKK